MDRKWLLLIIAALSVVCLLLAGYVVGQKIGHRSAISDHSMFMVFDTVLEPLPKHRRDEITTNVGATHRELGMALRKLEKIRLEVHNHSLSEELDPKALRQSMKRMRQLFNEVKEIQDERWVILLSHLSHEERELMINHLIRKFERHDSRNNKDSDRKRREVDVPKPVE